MSATEPSIFELIFNQSGQPSIVLQANPPAFSVVAQNKAQLALHPDLSGKRAYELFVTDATDAELQTAYAALEVAFKQSIAENVIIKLPAIKCFVKDPDGLQTHSVWTQIEVSPVTGNSNEVKYLICTIHDISKQVWLEAARKDGLTNESNLTEELAASNEELSATNEELSASNEELRQSQESLAESNRELENRVEERTHALAESESRFRAMVQQSPVPMLVTMGEAMVFTIINQPMLDLIGKDASVIGKPWHDAMPELEGQDIIGQLLDTYDSGLSWEGSEVPIIIYKSGTPELGFYNISYKPLIEGGETIGMLQSAIDVTEMVKTRLKVEELHIEQQTINEELAATNEELLTTNDELTAIQGKLENMVAELAESGQRLEQIINILPAAVVVIRGENLIVESINTNNLAYWHKTREQVIGKPLLEILPELASQPFPSQLRQVMQTGEIIDVKERPVLLTDAEGNQQETFVDYTYQPLTDSGGAHTGVLVMSSENTERVLSRKLLEQFSEEMQSLNEELTASNEELAAVNEELHIAQLAVEESRIALRLALDAAEIGTWFIHSETREFITDARLKELFGYYPEEPLTIEQALAQIQGDYRGFVATALENAIYYNGDYDVTYPVIGLHDQQSRWLRAIGNLKQDPSGTFSAFTGVVMDVTKQKNDEIRKNDFIGMVSHELKTPLTSLNGYLQMLQLKAKKTEDDFVSGALDQSVKQVKRMTTMINGFLNVSRLESAQIHIEKKPFDMADLILEMAEETQTLYASHQFIFHPVEPTQVIADDDKIGQVINNIISNAVKYSKTGTTIQIACVQLSGFARVSISDEGMGIDQAELSRLFERYYRVESNNHISGFGIGLYLSAEIIERHDGKIWAESERGKGSTFYFTLPMDKKTTD
jgi:PAS domain S-box-containing protein